MIRNRVVVSLDTLSASEAMRAINDYLPAALGRKKIKPRSVHASLLLIPLSPTATHPLTHPNSAQPPRNQLSMAPGGSV